MNIITTVIAGALFIALGIIALVEGKLYLPKWRSTLDFTGINQVGGYLFILIGIWIIAETLYVKYKKQK
jgi:putative Ca2+/H+ antiporter (TMEM165/GDT1 family)